MGEAKRTFISSLTIAGIRADVLEAACTRAKPTQKKRISRLVLDFHPAFARAGFGRALAEVSAKWSPVLEMEGLGSIELALCWQNAERPLSVRLRHLSAKPFV